jgi:predicted DNA-binding protein
LSVRGNGAFSCTQKKEGVYFVSGDKSPVRVNTRISYDTNEWLDKKSEEMALTKSALINMAIENYRKEVEVVNGFPEIINKLREMGIDLNQTNS